MTEFNIPDMSCGHCAGVVTRAVRELDPQAIVDVQLDRRTVQVESSLNRETLAKALAEAGYPAQ